MAEETGKLDERRLVARLAEGRVDAFGELYDRFGPRLYRTAARWLGSRDEAEDVVQDVFTSLVRSRVSLGQVDDLTAYLFCALRRMVTRAVQRRLRSPRTAGVQAESAAGGLARESTSDLEERLERALIGLPMKQREVVMLHIEAELTFAEIGRVLGISTNTAASRYRYALEKLKRSLESVQRVSE